MIHTLCGAYQSCDGIQHGVPALHCRDWHLNCYDNAHLQHVNIVDFVPLTFAFRASCKVHAEWTSFLEVRQSAQFADWAGSRMWRDQSVTLASIKIYAENTLEPSQAVQVTFMAGLVHIYP